MDENIVRFDSVGQYDAFNNNETCHPLVNVVDLAKAAPRRGARMYFGFYTIFLKDVHCGDLTYGRHTYDYQEGTLVFLAPGQVVGVKNQEDLYQPKGYALIFHPDLLHGTSLASHVQEYTFFGYQFNEGVHLSKRERGLVLDSFAKLTYELEQAIDKHSKQLIVAHLDLFLGYCRRFYERQFITRDHVHQGLLAQFETLLNQYFISDKPSLLGLPTVAYFATELHLSTSYFGDLVKKQTGRTAQEYIHAKLRDLAKERIFDRSKTVNEIAYELGFKYPQHFSRFFKEHVGQSPSEYRTAVA